MASWSENRSSEKRKVDPAVVAEGIKQVNIVLTRLAQDEDFQSDLAKPIVQRALKHWTNQQRLSPEEAQTLQDNRDVVYVFQRFQMISAVCKQADLPVPLDLILSRSAELPKAITDKMLGVSTEPAPAADKKPSAAAAVPSAPATVKRTKRPAQQQQAGILLGVFCVILALATAYFLSSSLPAGVV